MKELAAWLAGQWSWVTAVIVFALTWLLSRVGVLANKRTDAWLERQADRWAGHRKARSADRARRRVKKEHETMLRGLESERVGARFLRRESKDDPGTTIEVIGLDKQRPKHWVRTVPIGRTDDPPITTIEWRALTKPPAWQRHETARLDKGSDDDDDGWVVFQRVDHQP